jgi:hypothetical protein
MGRGRQRRVRVYVWRSRRSDTPTTTLPSRHTRGLRTRPRHPRSRAARARTPLSAARARGVDAEVEHQERGVADSRTRGEATPVRGRAQPSVAEMSKANQRAQFRTPSACRRGDPTGTERYRLICATPEPDDHARYRRPSALSSRASACDLVGSTRRLFGPAASPRSRAGRSNRPEQARFGARATVI